VKRRDLIKILEKLAAFSFDMVASMIGIKINLLVPANPFQDIQKLMKI